MNIGRTMLNMFGLGLAANDLEQVKTIIKDLIDQNDGRPEKAEEVEGWRILLQRIEENE